MLGDVLVHRLVACDALGLVLLTPQRADHLVHVLRLPRRVRRRAEHGEAGGGGGIADRVAPVVEGGRRQLVTGAQFVVLGDLVDLDVGLDADLAPHPHDRLDHLVVLGLETLGGLDRELDRLVGPEARLGEQLFGGLRVVLDLDRWVEGRVLRRFQRIDQHCIALQQLIHDGLLVHRVNHGQAHILVEHRVLVGDEDHPDVRDRVRDAGQVGLLGEAVELLERHFQRQIGGPALHLCDAARCIGNELEHDRLESRLRPPVLGERLEPDERVALELFHHVGTAADRLRFESLRALGRISLLGKHVASEEGHPLEQRGLELLDVGGDDVTVDLEVADLAPDELDRVAGLGIARALQRPDDVLGRDRRAVVPEGSLAHRHLHFGPVLAPAPLGEQPRLEREVGLLVDVRIEHRLVDRLDRRVHCRWPGGRIPGRQRDVVGDRQNLAVLRQRRVGAEERADNRCGGGRAARLQEAAA